jgi:hypothetical protein
MSGDIGIGKIIREERHRDAIHIAVAPVEALYELKPGERVGLLDGKAISSTIVESVGIVDPFLTHTVLPGQVFYLFLFLFPGTITSLRHEWVHPAFDEVPASVKPDMTKEKASSEKWLREYARRVNPYIHEENGEDEAYQTLMDGMSSGKLVYHGKDMHDRSELIDAEELRHHAEIVLGRKINYDDFEYFSCTC